MAQSEVDQMKARESATLIALRTEAARAYREYCEPRGYQDATPAALQAAIAAALEALATAWRSDAAWFTEQRRKGHVSTSTELKQAASRVAGAAVALAANPFETGGPVSIPLPSLVEQPSTPERCGALDPVALADGTHSGAACIREPHEPPSVHVNIRGDRWPSVATPVPDRLPIFDPEPIAPALELFEPDVPFMPGPRLSIREISGSIDPAARADHRSVSQVATFSDCGLKYRLERYHPDVIRMPSWSTVGGNTLHAAIAAYEADANIGNWESQFARQIETVERESGVPSRAWRASNRGKEGYDWWRVEGGDMLARYIDWSKDAGPIRDDMIEYDVTVDIAGVKVQCIIDQVRTTGDGTLHIIDVKSGARIPRDPFQLGVYAVALSGKRPSTVFGSYWSARTGELTTWDIWEHFTPEEIAYRITSMDAAERAGLYVPHTSDFCVSCSVGHACPVNPRR